MTVTPAQPDQTLELRQAQAMLPLEALRPHPKNVRFAVDETTPEFAEMVASIQQFGVLQALTVAPQLSRGLCPTCSLEHHLDVDGRLITHDRGNGSRRKICDGSGAAPTTSHATYVIVMGHRRHAAARAAGVTEVPCTIRYDLVTEADVILAMAVENLQRSDLTAIEEAAAYEQLQLAGLKATDIATKTGRNVGTVRARIKLMKLPEGTRQRLHTHQITIEDATRISKLSAETQARLEKTPPRELTWRIREAEQNDERDKAVAKAQRELAAANVTVVEERPSYRVDIEHLSRDHEGFDQASHRACPHHVAYIQPWGAVAEFCLDPSVHGLDASGAAAESASEAAARKKRESFEENVAIAAHLRAEHVRDYISGARKITPGQTDRILQLVASRVLGQGMHGLDAERLRTLGELPLKKSSRTQELRNAAADAYCTRPVQGLLLALLVDQDPDHPWAWRKECLRRPSDTRAWLDLLTESLGYELSTWEAEHLARADFGGPADDGDLDEGADAGDS